MSTPETRINRGRYSRGVALVTGAGRGIGQATARMLYDAGYAVAVADLDGDTAKEVAASLGERAIGLTVDVASHQSFVDCVRDVETALGPIKILVNNAGIMPLNHFLDESTDLAHRIVDVNCHGVLHGMKAVLPQMIERRGGHIINVASTAGTNGLAGAATYCSSKSFVITVSDAVRSELRGTGVKITTVLPGIVNTQLGAGLRSVKGIGIVEPDDVALAIAKVVERPRGSVFVPKIYGPVTRFANVLPPGPRDAVSRLLGGHKMMAEPDRARRASYEADVEAASHPHEG